MSIKFNQCHSRHSLKSSVYASPKTAIPRGNPPNTLPLCDYMVSLAGDKHWHVHHVQWKKWSRFTKSGTNRDLTGLRLCLDLTKDPVGVEEFFFHGTRSMTFHDTACQHGTFGKHWKTTTQACQIRSMIAARVIGLVLSKFRVESAIVIWSRPSGQDLSRSNLENGLTSSEKRKCMFNAPSRFH